MTDPPPYLVGMAQAVVADVEARMEELGAAEAQVANLRYLLTETTRRAWRMYEQQRDYCVVSQWKDLCSQLNENDRHLADTEQTGSDTQ